MKNRFTALFLCLLMAGASFSCGSDSPEGGNDTTAPGGETTAPADEGLKSGVPADVKFDGETVKILNGQYYDYYFQQLDVSEANGDTVNDAIYNRNLAVQDKLNVKLEFVNMLDRSPFEASNAFRQSVMAGDKAFDIMMGMQFRMVQLTIEDLFLNMIDIPYVDISNPWWYETYMESVNLNPELRYMLNGDFSLNFLRLMGAIYFNKDLMADYGKDPDALYDAVLDGTWTLDGFGSIIKDVYKDLNGNQQVDFDDQLGWISVPNAYPSYTLLFAAGGKVTDKTANGWKITTDLEQNVDIVEKLYKMMYETSGSFPTPLVSTIFDVELPQKFASGNMMMHVGLLMTSEYLREMDDSYGIIPFPKYDEAQENYRAVVQDLAATAALPKNSNNIEMCAAVMEEMAYQGYMDMLPQYYSVAMKNKYMRDTDDKAMQIIDIIHDAAWSEVGFVHAFNMNSLAMIPRTMLAEKASNYMTRWAEKLPAAEEKFAQLLEYYNK